MPSINTKVGYSVGKPKAPVVSTEPMRASKGRQGHKASVGADHTGRPGKCNLKSYPKGGLKPPGV